MRVLFATAEAYPLAKSGGLGDVCHALPLALRAAGVDVRIILPGYDCAIQKLENPRIEARLSPTLGEEGAFLLAGTLPQSDLPVLLVCAPKLYESAAGLYKDAQGGERRDDARRFGYFARIAAKVAMGQTSNWNADIVHAHDWHAGLVPLFLSQETLRPATVFTIHNLAFQGNFHREAVAQAGIPEQFFSQDGVEFYGQVSFLKAALRFSNKITTVSTQYCREILTEDFGCGFHGLLQARQPDLSGILNGIDTAAWNPESDPALVQPYTAKDIFGKRMCKGDFQRFVGLEVDTERPLLGFVSRISHQKMADVLLEVAPRIAAAGAQLAVVGNGDALIERALRETAARLDGRVAVAAYNEELAHRLQAGADILLAPARFEPCGLTQMYALRYGTLPIVRRTGGLAESVVDATDEAIMAGSATGFVFDNASPDSLFGAVSRALALYREPLAWRRMQLAGMDIDFGWQRSASQYISLYEELSGLRIGKPDLQPLVLERSAA